MMSGTAEIKHLILNMNIWGKYTKKKKFLIYFPKIKELKCQFIEFYTAREQVNVKICNNGKIYNMCCAIFECLDLCLYDGQTAI